MKNGYNRSAINKMCSIEAAEQYLIARTHEELAQAAGSVPVESFAQAIYRPVLAIGLTTTFIWFLKIDAVSDFLAATV